jgi:hypothetical protein
MRTILCRITIYYIKNDNPLPEFGNIAVEVCHVIKRREVKVQAASTKNETSNTHFVILPVITQNRCDFMFLPSKEVSDNVM